MPAYQYRSADGASIIAGPTLALGTLFASLSAEVDTAFTKLCVDNIGDRKVGVSPLAGVVLRRLQLGTNDGEGFILTAADPNGTISRPWGDDVDANNTPTGAPTAVRSVGGGSGWSISTIYGVVVTALNATGETIASFEKTFQPLATNDTWTITWTRVPGATSYKVYLTTTPGTYGASTLVSGAVSDPAHTKVLLGPTTVSGTPATTNTTGGAGPNYGTAPSIGSFGVADLTIGSDPVGFAVGQQFFFYLAAKLPAGSNAVGNTRGMQISPIEVS